MHPVIWGGLTMVTAAATNVRHLYVIRFFQGMAEASTFVGAVSQAFCDNV
jgi:ACS family pantothenate transporter-like MFS transporter